MDKTNTPKVCIISTVNLMHMTLSSLYTNYFQKNDIPYDIIYIDKYGIDEFTDAANIYKYRVKNRKSKVLKIFNVLRFVSFAKKLIYKNDYDLLIVWNELTAVLMSNFLAKKYKNKYVINIRDYGFNDLPIIKKRTQKVIEASSFTMISSNRFMEFLPKIDKYLFVHSYNEEIFKNIDFKYRKKDKNQIITILFIGKMSYFKEAINFIEKLGNDNRFKLKFVGAGTELLEPYIMKNKIKNIELIGKFSPNETAKYLIEADIIYNLYGFGAKDVDTLLSIKLYYAIYLNMPILIYDNTHTNTYAKNAGINITIPNKKIINLADIIYEKYQTWDEKKAKEKSAAIMKEIKDSHNMLYNKLGELLKKDNMKNIH
ncbi:MAG: hypothetical protein ACOX02_03405 [Acholeplasmatales bacterium]